RHGEKDGEFEVSKRAFSYQLSAVSPQELLIPRHLELCHSSERSYKEPAYSRQAPFLLRHHPAGLRPDS
ncbi:MAG TPA: hypothetical protein VND65_13780, partial [Candidatus Binatia bacterium]|nr:hypothetical protein [Candidatus Binatia bacterium]